MSSGGSFLELTQAQAQSTCHGNYARRPFVSHSVVMDADARGHNCACAPMLYISELCKDSSCPRQIMQPAWHCMAAHGYSWTNMLELASVWQGLWMNSWTLITIMAIGPGSVSRNHPLAIVSCYNPGERFLHSMRRQKTKTKKLYWRNPPYPKNTLYPRRFFLLLRNFRKKLRNFHKKSS